VALFATFLPVIVAWLRELLAADLWRAFVYGVLLGGP
jgi:hypothetical protein